MAESEEGGAGETVSSGSPPSPSPSREQGSPVLSEEEEGLLEGEGEEGVGQLLRNTVDELESALQETRQLLAARDEELSQLKLELDRYKQQAAREIANKTRLAQALDQSQSHVAQLEELLQDWQLQLQESKLQGERLQSALHVEKVRNQELESRLASTQDQDREIEKLRSHLEKFKLKAHGRGRSFSSSDTIDAAQQLFLKQAVYHLLTDTHAEEQLRAIISILDFSAAERKTIYSKIQEKGGLYK